VRETVEAVAVEGYTSIRSQRVDLRGLNVLVGPNGGGKSNFISALEMLGRIVDEELSYFVGVRGGAAAMQFAGRDAQSHIRMRLDVRRAEDQTGSYESVLVPAAEDELIFGDELIEYHDARYREPWQMSLGRGHRETRLHGRQSGRGSWTAQFVVDVLRGCRVFHFHDTSLNAPVKQRGSTADNLSLHNDAGNLAAFLLRLQEDQPDHYQNILRTIQLVAPFLRNFVLKAEGQDQVRLRWRAYGSDRVFGAESLSDGTLRFICLATLFLGPGVPRLVVLDEPELGLHPYAIAQFAGLVRQAVRRGRQVLLATQSVTLMNQFALENLVVVERERGESVFHRPDRDELSHWLDDYSLGELWEKNLLGGRPSPERGAIGA
jgi:predicted ATPase